MSQTKWNKEIEETRKLLRYIKTKKDFIIDLQDFILNNSNAELISVDLHFTCKRFIKEIEKIPLSNELQPTANK